MRLLTEIPDPLEAQRLVDALSDQGVECELKGGPEAPTVWVHDELQLKRAQSLTEEWSGEEGRAGLEAAAKRGRAGRDRKLAAQARLQRERDRLAAAAANLPRRRATPLTFGLIALCIGVAFLTQLGEDRAMFGTLTIVDPALRPRVLLVQLGGLSFYWLGLPWDEPWRLLTPILMHVGGLPNGLLHIFFNMLWLKELGGVIESRHGSRYLATFIVLSGAISNIAQYEIEKNPLFAGMSGVVYGLLGLIWIRGKLDPGSGYALAPSTVQFMLIWMVLGFVMASSIPMANWCHLGGLIVGMTWGALAARFNRPRALP